MTPSPTSDSDLGELVERLRELLEKATPGDLDTAERKIGVVEDCPLCGGEGCIDGEAYVNIDAVALSVGFYGIGPEFGALEALWRAALPAFPTLLDALAASEARAEALEKERDGLREGLSKRAEQYAESIDNAGAMIVQITARANKAEAEVAGLKAVLGDLHHGISRGVAPPILADWINAALTPKDRP